MTSQFLKQLGKKVIILDGGMGSMLAAKDLTSEDYGGKTGCPEALLLHKPSVIAEVHEAYFATGADVVETCTFGANRIKLVEYGLEDKVYEINSKAVKIAKECAKKYSTKKHPRFVAASFAPTGRLPSSNDPSLSITTDELEEIYFEQARAHCEEDVDVFIIETQQDILETRSAIFGIRRQLKASKKNIPIIAQVTLDKNGRMLLGTDIRSAITTLEGFDVDVIGINCSTGPEEMADSVRFLGEFCTKKISCLPNAGMPENRGGKAVYPLSPQALAEHLEYFVTHYGINIVGGCCGTNPEHIKAIVETISVRKPVKKKAPKRYFLSSAITHESLHQDPRPLIIGERLNAQGSRRTKEVLLAEDYDAAVTIARQQVDAGAHVLDLSVALSERENEPQLMSKLVKVLSLSVPAPLMIDSTDPAVIEAASKVMPGRGIINSVNLEKGDEKLKTIFGITKKYGHAVVAMTIDEKGMAQTAARKFEIAKRIFKIATKKFKIDPAFLIFDLLTFTLATGDPQYASSAIETLDGIKKVKRELPDVLTVLGVSNISYGLLPEGRNVLNSVFLYHAVQAGLDCAIVNPLKITSYASIPEVERTLSENLIFKKGMSPLTEFIRHFRDKSKKDESTKPVLETSNLPIDQKIKLMVINRSTEDIDAIFKEAMKKYKPVEIINELLLEAMKEVGEKFGTGELILPFVLQSAEVMQKIVTHLEPYLEKHDKMKKRGKILLATVYGDVHDIGKNLVKTILSHNGYEVIDLGKQVPVAKIIEKAEEVGADVIGLSALLVSTSKEMPYCVQELSNRGMNYPVVIGGAAINRRFGREIFFVENNRPYAGGVFYARDAFEGLEIINQLTDPSQKNAFYEKQLEEALKEKNDGRKTKDEGRNKRKSQIKPAENVPVPPFHGSQVIGAIDLKEIFPLIDQNTLFRLSWGAKGQDVEKFKPLLASLTEEVIAKAWFDPKIIYGYFQCQADGNDLVILDTNNIRRELARFKFPRQDKEEALCIADYFQPMGSTIKDVVAFQVVTVGAKGSETVEKFQQAGEVTKAYYLHGLSVATAEALAEWNHRRIKKELGLPEAQGRRYSFGYPICPPVSDQRKLFDLLQVEEKIGVHLTEACQMVPEQSTSAIIVHHPKAIYFQI